MSDQRYVPPPLELSWIERVLLHLSLRGLARLPTADEVMPLQLAGLAPIEAAERLAMDWARAIRRPDFQPDSRKDSDAQKPE